MSRFNQRTKSPLPKTGAPSHWSSGHNDPSDEIKSRLSLNAESRRTVETSVTRARARKQNLTIDTSMETIESGVNSTNNSSTVVSGKNNNHSVRSSSPNVPVPSQARISETPQTSSDLNKKVLLTPGQQMLLKQLQIQKAQDKDMQGNHLPRDEAIQKAQDKDMQGNHLPRDEASAMSASLTASYGKLPLSRGRRPSSESTRTIRSSISIDTTNSGSASQTRELQELVNARREAEPGGVSLKTKRRESMPGLQSGASSVGADKQGDKRPPAQPHAAAATPARTPAKVVLKVKPEPSPMRAPAGVAATKEPIIYTSSVSSVYSRYSARWLQLSSALWSMLVLDSRRNLSRGFEVGNDAGVVDTHSVRQLLQVMKMRQDGDVNDAEMVGVLEAWGMDDLPNGATKQHSHVFSVYHLRRLLSEDNYNEAEIAMFVGILVNVMSFKADISDSPSPSKALLRQHDWHLAVEKLFFTYDARGHGVWSFDEVFIFGSALVVGFSGQHDLSNDDRSPLASGDEADWKSSDDVRSDLQIGLLSAYAVKLLELMQVCVPLKTVEVETQTGRGDNFLGSRYTSFKQSSSASTNGFIWKPSSNATLAMTLLGPGSPIDTTDALLDENLPSVEYGVVTAESSEDSTPANTKTSFTATALARRGSILGGGKKGSNEQKMNIEKKNNRESAQKSKPIVNRYGKFFVTLPMLKAFLISAGARGRVDTSMVMKLVDHSKLFLRRLGKILRKNTDASPSGNNMRKNSSENTLYATTRSLYDAVEKATQVSAKTGSVRYTELLAKFLNSDGHKYLPVMWRAKGGNRVDKGDDHVVARRLLVIYQRWVGSEKASTPKAARRSEMSSVDYLNGDDSDDEGDGILTAKELERVQYSFICNVLVHYRTSQSQLIDALIEVATRHYVQAHDDTDYPPRLARKKRTNLINKACASILPDIEAMLYTLEVADEEEMVEETKETYRSDAEKDSRRRGEITDKTEMEGNKKVDRRFTVPVPASQIKSMQSSEEQPRSASPGTALNASGTSDALGLFGPPINMKTEDSLDIFGGSQTKGILKKSQSEPEDELELLPPDDDGWAPVAGIGASPPKGISKKHSSGSDSTSHSKELAFGGGEIKPKSGRSKSPARKQWYRVVNEEGAVIKAAPSGSASSIGRCEFDDMVEVTGNLHVENEGLTYIELVRNRGWVPMTSSSGNPVLESVSRPPTPSDVSTSKLTGYNGSAPRDRANSETTSVKSANTHVSQASKSSSTKKGVIHYLRKAVGLHKPKQETEPEAEFQGGDGNEDSGGQREDAPQADQDEESHVSEAHSDTEASDFDQLDALENEPDKTRVPSQRNTPVDVRTGEPSSSYSANADTRQSEEGENKIISLEEHSLLDALITADDPRDQAYLVQKLKEIRSASTPSVPSSQGVRERYASPRTDYFRGFFSSIADEQYRSETPIDHNRSTPDILPRTSAVYLDVSEDGTDAGTESIADEYYNAPPLPPQSEYTGRQRSSSRDSDDVKVKNMRSAGSIAEMLTQGQSAGKYAQTLRHILREMSASSSKGNGTTTGSNDLQMQHLEEVLRLGQAIATEERQHARALREEQTDQGIHPPAHSRTPVQRQTPSGRPPLSGKSSLSVSRATGMPPKGRSSTPNSVTYSEDPYAFTNRRPKTVEKGQTLPNSGRSRREVHTRSSEEDDLRKRIRALELQERRMEREERQKSSGSIRRGSYFGAHPTTNTRNTSEANRSARATRTGIAEQGRRNQGSLSNVALFEETPYHQSTPARAYEGTVVRGSAAAPGSVSRLQNGVVPGMAPKNSTKKQPKMAFGARI